MKTTTQQELLSSFGKRLAALRKQRDLTQAQLAEKMNMSVVMIAYIETGRRWVGIVTLIKLSEVLGVEIEELFHFQALR